MRNGDRLVADGLFARRRSSSAAITSSTAPRSTRPSMPRRVSKRALGAVEVRPVAQM
jgi:hypothetical protein